MTHTADTEDEEVVRMRKKITVVAIIAMAMLAALVPMAGSAGATNIGYEGCTPGYWKNHTENWQEYSPTTKLTELGEVGKPGWKFNAQIAGYGDWTLLQALNAQGGAGLNGGAEILIRAGAAAWLNAAHEGVAYPYRRFGTGLDGRPALLTLLNTALQSGSRPQMVSLATTLDDANNLGCML